MCILQPKHSGARARYGALSFSVRSSFDGPLPTGTSEIVMSVRWQLAGRQVPMTVLDRANRALSRLNRDQRSTTSDSTTMSST